jgi:hypothetical protein
MDLSGLLAMLAALPAPYGILAGIGATLLFNWLRKRNPNLPIPAPGPVPSPVPGPVPPVGPSPTPLLDAAKQLLNLLLQQRLAAKSQPFQAAPADLDVDEVLTIIEKLRD